MPKLVIISGQSNAYGALSVGPPSAPELNGPISNAYIWNHTAQQWETLEWRVNNYTGNPDEQTIADTGVGAELRIGYDLAQEFGEVYIVKSSRSGTALGNERSTSVDFCPAGDEWRKLHNRVVAAVANLGEQNVEYYGFLWNQGERDASNQLSYLFKYNCYAYNLSLMINERIRNDFPVASSCPVVAVRINTTSHATMFIREQIENATQAARDCAYIDIDDAADNSLQGYVDSQVHYTELWQDYIGQRFIAAVDIINAP